MCAATADQIIAPIGLINDDDDEIALTPRRTTALSTNITARIGKACERTRDEAASDLEQVSEWATKTTQLATPVRKLIKSFSARFTRCGEVWIC